MINDSVKEVMRHKANRIKNSHNYLKYLSELFEELNITDTKEAALFGAIDAMIYDIACSLDFTKKKGEVDDWSSYDLRKGLLKELFEETAS